jgi:hypothetical protein
MKLRGFAAIFTLLALLAPAAAQEAKKEEKPARTESTRLFRTEPNIELTVYLMAGLAEASQQNSLPKELDRVTKQLKTLFTYKAYGVLDTIILRARNQSSASVEGSAPTPGSAEIAPYSVNFSGVQLAPDEKGNVVRVGRLQLIVRVPSPTAKGTEYRAAGFTTSIDLREGQSAVVGKANIDGSKNALILVVTAKVVD